MHAAFVFFACCREAYVFASAGCAGTGGWIDSREECEAAAVRLGLSATWRQWRPRLMRWGGGCYYQHPHGNLYVAKKKAHPV